MSTSDEPLLELHRVSFRDGETAILTEVSLTVFAREILGVVFQQGIGKTALLHLAAGLLEPSAGEVVYRGERIAKRPASPTLGMVFEDDGGLLPNLTVFENIALPLRYHTRASEPEVRAKVSEVLSVAGVQEVADKHPWQLTRDRQRLAALARALITEPDLVFVDDLYQGADAEAYGQMRETILLAREAYGTAFLLVLESSAEDFDFCDRICLIDHGAVLELTR